MGTNFYAKRTPKLSEINEAHKKLTYHLLYPGSYSDDFLEYINSISEEIHLGKRSAGWQFLWHYHPDKYQDNLESIKIFLSSPDYKIYDEYGEEFTVDQFLGEEIKSFLYSGYTSKSYEKEHPNEPSYRGGSQEWISKDGLRFIDTNFS